VAEVPDGPGVLDKPGDGVSAEALEFAVDLEPLPVDEPPLAGFWVGTAELEVPPGLCVADVATAATAPVGAVPPAAGRLPRTSRPMTAIPAKPPVTVALSPRPLCLRERRIRRPVGTSEAESPT
jgi:hypothetical protein